MERYKNKVNRLIAVGLLASTALAASAYHAEAKRPAPEVTQLAAQMPQAAQLPVAESTELIKGWASALNGYPGQVDIAVHDRKTGQTVRYPDTNRTFNTASTIKLSILMEMLLENQAANIPLMTPSDPHSDCEDPDISIPVQLTCEQLELAKPMIEESDDDAASALWVMEGAPNALNDFENQIGATATVPEPLSQWGWSQTTATDQLKVLNLLSDPASPLSAGSKATVNFLLDHVDPQQHWGDSGGVPTGATVRLKDGWMNYSETAEGPWTMNSLANVNDNTGTDYDIAILTDGNPTDQDGINIIEKLSATTWQVLHSSEPSNH